MKKNHFNRIAAGCGALALIGIVLFYYFAFNGNPFAVSLYQPKIETYIEKNYPGHEYKISYSFYDFKNYNYYYDVTDPDSEDGSFLAYYDHGTVYDTYEEDVQNMGNTLSRLNQGFHKKVDPIVDSYLDKKTKNNYMTAEWGSATVRVDEELYLTDGLKDKHILDELYPDMPFDPKNMPLPTGIFVKLNTDHLQSFQRVQEIAKDMASRGYRIDYYSYSCDENSNGYDNSNYLGYSYKNIPVSVMLSAKSPADLEPYLYLEDMHDTYTEQNQKKAATSTHATMSGTTATSPSSNP